jgi:hypothetical protein
VQNAVNTALSCQSGQLLRISDVPLYPADLAYISAEKVTARLIGRAARKRHDLYSFLRKAADDIDADEAVGAGH